MKIINWWKNWWESRWTNCGLIVDKAVDKQDFGKSVLLVLWNCGLNGGLNGGDCEFLNCDGGKTTQINKLCISGISTIST